MLQTQGEGDLTFLSHPHGKVSSSHMSWPLIGAIDIKVY